LLQLRAIGDGNKPLLPLLVCKKVKLQKQSQNKIFWMVQWWVLVQGIFWDGAMVGAGSGDFLEFIKSKFQWKQSQVSATSC
jgi:hypothetical protein